MFMTSSWPQELQHLKKMASDWKQKRTLYTYPCLCSLPTESTLSHSAQKLLFKSKEIFIVDVSGPDTRIFLYLFGRHQRKLETFLDSLTVGT